MSNTDYGFFILVFLSAVISAVVVGLLAWFFSRAIIQRILDHRILSQKRTAPKDLLHRHNLPRRGPFIGRRTEVNRIIEILKGRLPIVVIEGFGGTGKTSLALETAYLALENDLFDTAIWVAPIRSPDHLEFLIDNMAKALEAPGIVKLPTQQKPEAMLDLLRGKSCLIIVDGIEDLEFSSKSLKYLEKIPEYNHLIVTSRVMLPLESAVIDLGGLENADAISLIREEAKRLDLMDISQASEEELQLLINASGGSPLAIKWALGKIAFSGNSFFSVINDLLSAEGEIFNTLLEYAWSQLNDSSRWAIGTISIFPMPVTIKLIEKTNPYLAELVDQPITQLLGLNLIQMEDEIEESPRFSTHPLAAVYIGSKLEKSTILEIHNRAIDYYVDFSLSHGGRWWKLWSNVEDLLALDKELENIRYILNFCSQNKRERAFIDITSGIHTYLGLRGHVRERIYIGIRAARFARIIKDHIALAWLTGIVVAWGYWLCRDLNKTRWYAIKGLQLAQDTKVAYVEAYSYHLLVLTSLFKGDISQAEHYCASELEVAEQTNNKSLIGVAQADMGLIQMNKRNYKLAEDWLRKSKGALEKIGDYDKLSGRVILLGDVMKEQHEIDEAAELYRAGLSIAKMTKRLDYMALGYLRIAEFLLYRGDLANAAKYAIDASEAYQRLGVQEYSQRSRELLDSIEMRSPSR